MFTATDWFVTLHPFFKVSSFFSILQLCYPVELHLEPAEKDLALLKIFTNQLMQQVISEKRTPMLYLLCIHHLNHWLLAPATDSPEAARMRKALLNYLRTHKSVSFPPPFQFNLRNHSVPFSQHLQSELNWISFSLLIWFHSLLIHNEKVSLLHCKILIFLKFVLNSLLFCLMNLTGRAGAGHSSLLSAGSTGQAWSRGGSLWWRARGLGSYSVIVCHPLFLCQMKLRAENP